MIKDTDEEPNEQILRAGWGGSEHRSFCPMELGSQPKYVDVFIDLEALPVLLDFYSGFIMSA